MHPAAFLTTPENPVDATVTLRISRNKLVRMLNAANAHPAAEHGNGELAAIIDAARDVFAEQRRIPAPGEQDFADICHDRIVAANAGDAPCRLRDACWRRKHASLLTAPETMPRWQALAVALELLSNSYGDLR